MGILIGFVGIIFVFSSQGTSLSSDYFLGNLYAILGALTIAIYIVFCRKLRKEYSWSTIMFWVFGLGGIFIMIESAILGQTLLNEPNLNDWLYLAGLGVIGTLIGHTLFNASLKYIKSSTASIFSIITPIAAIFYALILLGEIPSFLTILGLIFATIGIYIVVKNAKT